MSEQRPTRELWRFVDFYGKNIRATSKADSTGVIRQIQRLIDKGIGLEDIATALENYAKDEWRMAQTDPKASKPMRSFFTAETIKEWLTPRKFVKKLRTIDKIALFTSDYVPPPAVVEEEIDDPQSADEL